MRYRHFLCTLSIDQEVVVVGAGPTGLLLSQLLASFGIRVTVLEKAQSIPTHPKAHFLNHRTLEILRPLGGLSAKIIHQTPALDQWRKFIYCETLTRGVFGVVDHFPVKQRTPFQLHLSPEPVVHFSQNRLLSLLLKQVQSNDFIKVLFSLELLRCNIRADGVLLTYKAHELKKELFSRYVVFANGANSTFLSQVGIRTHGTTTLQNLLSIHFHSEELSRKLRKNPGMMYFVFNQDVILVLVVHNLLAGEFVAQIPYFPPLQQPSDFSTNQCADFIHQAAGWKLKDLRIESVKPWRMKSEIAESFQEEKVFFVGDAAHVFPPAGGFGLNTGIQDAHNLAWKLASVIQGYLPEKSLETYTKERHPVGKQNAELSLKNWEEALEIPKALGLDLNHASLLNNILSGALGSRLPQPITKSLLTVGLSIGRQIGGYKGPLAALRRKRVEEILLKGQSLRLQYPKEDLGFVYHSMTAFEQPVRQGWKDRTAPFLQEFRIGCRVPHCWLKLKTSDKIISSLDVISWSELKYTIFLHKPDPKFLKLLHKSPESSSFFSLVLVWSFDRKLEEEVNEYIPFLESKQEYFTSQQSWSVLEVIDVDRKWFEWSNTAREDMLVVRPDGHILSMHDTMELKDLSIVYDVGNLQFQSPQ